MKVIMSVDSMFTVELTEELEAEFSKPDFNINKMALFYYKFVTWY